MWKRILCGILASLTLLSCCACGNKEQQAPKEKPYSNAVDPKPADPDVKPEPQPEPEPEPEPVPDAVVNPLTGEALEDESLVNARPVAVMLNNIHYAMPQHGTSDADMIFEFNVEGSITRMVAFYQDPSKVGTIGSVRSARACFIETIMGMDAIYVHAGGSAEAKRMLRELNVDHISESAGEVFWRDAERRKTMAIEHTLMTSGERILNYIDKSSFRREHNEDYSYPITYVENATPAGGEAAEHVVVKFSGYKQGYFDYNAETGLYQISQRYSTLGTVDPYMDGNTGEQVAVTNLIVLRTTVANSGDSKGHMNIDLKGGNVGMFFCGGKAEPITWKKATTNDPFTFYHEDGTPLELQVGHTYVCVIGLNADLTYEG